MHQPLRAQRRAKIRKRWQEGATALNERRFDDALTAFTAAAAQLPNDGMSRSGRPCAFMLGRAWRRRDMARSRVEAPAESHAGIDRAR
jgi:hypothetical protein